jgi:hypothetical protein
MGAHVHKLTNKDFEARTADCANCGPVQIIVYGNTYRCEVAYRQHQKRMKADRRGTLTDIKSDTCIRCGFQAEDRCQMDLDHIDGDRRNHVVDNMQTLCSNCHRLKSWRPHLF